jgi:hypothetical protein
MDAQLLNPRKAICMNLIDFIGDIHGHADQLEGLLSQLGYDKKNGTYTHRERSAIFVGDYIDRGPDNPRTIHIVRKMVDAGAAIALCGNHEYNAICFNTPGPGGYLRPHTEKNKKQHAQTLRQFQGRQDQYIDAINWFKTLPLYYETDDYRVVHAAWDAESIHYLRRHTKDGIIPEELYLKAADKQSELHHAVETTCKGKEIALPAGVSFTDKDGVERSDIRLKWWLNPQGKTFQQMSVAAGLSMQDIPFETDGGDYYKEDEKPVFFGHYWLTGTPELYRDNVCCLDYSVARKGYLCCYRFSGEKKLENKHFVFI